MKRTLLAINLLLLVIIVFLACKHDGPPTHDDDDQCAKLHAKNYTGTERRGYLGLKAAKEMSQAYDADRQKAYISEGGKITAMEDAHRIWFSIEDLKQYIWQMEDTLCKQGCNMDSLNLGLHIYFAKYPDTAATTALGADSKYAKHQTVFMTATYKGKTNNIDFDPWYIGKDKCKPTPLSKFLREPKSSNGNWKEGERGPGVLNHGTLAPPPTGSGGFPTDDGEQY